jgi:diguanylate cyclase (GGDEF)-like protein/PAS domain S-box-containing protein
MKIAPLFSHCREDGTGMENSTQDERLRLQALDSLQILDTEPEEIFDRLTRFAAQICHMPIAAITLIAEERQWFKSIQGLELHETPRSISFCTHTIRHKHPFVVHDARSTPGFADNPLVTGPPFLRFYAGVPLINSAGYAIGTLAVMDRVPRSLNEEQLNTLRLLAEQVMVHIELRVRRNELHALTSELDRMNARLLRQAEHLTEAQRIAEIGSWEFIPQGNHLFCSEQVYRIFGIHPPRESETLERFMESVYADDRPQVQAALTRAIEQGAGFDVQHRIVRPGGNIRHVHERGRIRMNETGSKVLAGTVQDITEQVLAQQQLRLLSTSVDRINDIVMITEAEPIDEPGPRIVFVNAAFEDITGYPPAEAIGRSPRFLQGPETDRVELARIREALERKEQVTAELVNYTRDGKRFWMEMSIAPVTDAARKITHFVAVQRDVTARKQTEAEIERLAFFDQLTGLPNRRLLVDRLQHALSVAVRNGKIGALLFIDLDNFKTLNDTLGHDKGDILLVNVARRLESCTRRSNTVARLGGDEFVIMLEDLNEDQAVAAAQTEAVAEQVLAALAPPVRLDGSEFSCLASIGMTLFHHRLCNIDELLRRADIAMYHAKAAGRGTARFFDPELQAILHARATLERDMKRALNEQQFVLHYQPQVNSTGALTGFEALVRWHHPRQGMVYPNTFIHVAEESGLILQLGRWILREACRQAKRWKLEREIQHDAQHVTISVNVSVREFRQPGFARHTAAVIAEENVEPGSIKLELTEGLLIEDFGDVVAKMEELKAYGIGFSLDDFGTGYSSLAYLKRLPLDQLKIDRSFVKDVLTDPNDAAIARTIVSLGQTLGLEVIAEGVEAEDQRIFLEQHGCHNYQGLLFGEPRPAPQAWHGH